MQAYRTGPLHGKPDRVITRQVIVARSHTLYADDPESLFMFTVGLDDADLNHENFAIGPPLPPSVSGPGHLWVITSPQHGHLYSMLPTFPLTDKVGICT